MAKVTITIEDKPGKENIAMKIESDPPFDNQDQDKNTVAQNIGGELFYALVQDFKAGEEGDEDQ